MKKLVILSALVFAAACAGVDDGNGNGDMGPDAGAGEPDSDTADTTAPAIASITPADAATGVRADAVVTFVFSEPMDRLSVQNSIDTSDLGGVTFQWTDDVTMVVTPDNDLAYADGDGNDPSEVTANRYVVTLGTGATDEAGNNLEIGGQTVFTTLKSMKTSFDRDNALTGAGTPVGVTTDNDDFLNVGDDDAGGLAAGYRGYITMDIADLPETTVEIVAAPTPPSAPAPGSSSTTAASPSAARTRTTPPSTWRRCRKSGCGPTPVTPRSASTSPRRSPTTSPTAPPAPTAASTAFA